MKKSILVLLCFISISLLFTSCASRMNGVYFPTPEDGNWDNDTLNQWDRSVEDRGTNPNTSNLHAGDYQADKNGHVRSYNSDNNYLF